jgi:pyruvate,water dikinase
VRPLAAGVAFTLNPTDGDRSTVAIDASWGLGEAVVGGEVNPDNFLVDKVMFEVVRRTISRKEVEYRVKGDSVQRVTVDVARQEAPCLTDRQITDVARLARLAEKHYGHPQDVEWALDGDLAEGENVLLLQARPETVWSRRHREPIGRARGTESIVATLLAPLNAARQSGKEERAHGS